MDVDDLSKAVALLNNPKEIIGSGVFSPTYASRKFYAPDLYLKQLPTIAIELGIIEDYRRLVSIGIAIRKYQAKNTQQRLRKSGRSD